MDLVQNRHKHVNGLETNTITCWKHLIANLTGFWLNKQSYVFLYDHYRKWLFVLRMGKKYKKMNVEMSVKIDTCGMKYVRECT